MLIISEYHDIFDVGAILCNLSHYICLHEYHDFQLQNHRHHGHHQIYDQGTNQVVPRHSFYPEFVVQEPSELHHIWALKIGMNLIFQLSPIILATISFFLLLLICEVFTSLMSWIRSAASRSLVNKAGNSTLDHSSWIWR